MAVSTTRPLHLRWSAIGLVAAGGAIGTFARYGVMLLMPEWRGMPLPIFVVNVTGAFLLGWLLASLAGAGPDDGARRAMRLFAGTGILGGFTTYSTFAVGTDGLFLAAQPGLGIGYAVATIVVGAAASLAGIAVGTRRTAPESA